MRLAEHNHLVSALRRTEPIKRSTQAFCQGREFSAKVFTGRAA
jgi:hypothetical protein